MNQPGAGSLPAMPTAISEKVPDNIPELEEQLVILEKELAATRDQLAATLAAENPELGVYWPAEIHNLKQHKLRLQVEKDFRLKRIARLKTFASEA